MLHLPRASHQYRRIRRQNRECLWEICQWIMLGVFCGLFYIYFFQIVHVIQKLKYKALQLTNSKLFIPPPTIFKQEPEGAVTVPKTIFQVCPTTLPCFPTSLNTKSENFVLYTNKSKKMYIHFRKAVLLIFHLMYNSLRYLKV